MTARARGYSIGHGLRRRSRAVCEGRTPGTCRTTRRAAAATRSRGRSSPRRARWRNLAPASKLALRDSRLRRWPLRLWRRRSRGAAEWISPRKRSSIGPRTRSRKPSPQRRPRRVLAVCSAGGSTRRDAAPGATKASKAF